MFDKIKTYQDKIIEEMHVFQDVRAIGIVAFLIIALLISWSGVKVIETNYGLQKEIARMQQETEVQHLENQNLQLENQYFETDEYLELEARKNFGLAAPGETVLVVPKQVALKNITTTSTTTASGETKPIEQSSWKRNVDAWTQFLLNRNQ